MAVKIPVYRQQTGTPNARVRGGDPMVVRGPDLGGALMQVAGVVAGISRDREQKRKEQEDSVASAWAAKNLAETQSLAARELIRLKQTAGEGGAGVVDGINAWIDQRSTELAEMAPNDVSRNYIRDRLVAYKGTLDLNALEYETAERERWTVSSYDDGINAAASTAALESGMAQQLVAEQVAAIKSDRNISEPVRAKLMQNAIEVVSEGEVLGELERDPYAALSKLNVRLGLAGDTSGPRYVVARDEAIRVVSEIESQSGNDIPAGRRQEAVAAVMSGDDFEIKFNDAGEVSIKAGGNPGDAGFAYNSLSVPKVVELRSRAEAEIARRENEAKQANEYGKVLFAQRLNDITTQLQSGEPASLPSMTEMEFYLGKERALVQMAELQTYQSMAGELAAMNGLPNDELAAIAVDAPKGEANRQFRQAAYNAKLNRIEQITKARAADPGQYVIDSSKTVAGVYANYTAEAQRVAQLGDRATQQDFDSVINAQNRYIATSTMEQRRLGIAEPRLPKAFVASVTSEFQAGLKSDTPQLAAARVEALAQSMAGTPEAIGEIATDDLTAFAVDGLDGLTIKRIAETAKIKEAQLKELMPTDVAWADVERAVTQEFGPLLATFAAQGDKENASRYVRAGQLLATDRLVNGQASSPAEAAQAAYAELFASRNTAVGTYRVPNAYPAPIVETGLTSFLARIPVERLAVDTAPWMTEADKIEAGERLVRTIRQQARWANNQMGDGVYLMHAGGPVRGADGLPIEVKFSEALRMAAENPDLPATMRPRTPFEMR